MWLKVTIYSTYGQNFAPKLVCLGFRVQTTCKKNLDMISWKLQIFFKYLTFGGNFFVFKRIKKERNDYQKLDIRKKSTIFKISSPNFLCKLSTSYNSIIAILSDFKRLFPSPSIVILTSAFWRDFFCKFPFFGNCNFLRFEL